MVAAEAMAVAAVVVAAEAADDAVAKTTASCRCRPDSCCTRQPSRGSLGRPPTWLDDGDDDDDADDSPDNL